MATHPARPIDIGDYRKIRLWLNAGGYYEIRWSDAARRYASQRESTKCKVLAQAETYLLAWCDAVRQHTAALSQPAVPTVEDLCGRWLTHVMPQGKAGTGRRVLAAPRRILGRHTADQLNGQLLQDYSLQRGAGISDGTIRRELTALKTVLLWAAEERLIGRDDVPSFKRVVPPQGPPRTKFLDNAQEAFLWDQALLWGTRDHGHPEMQTAAYRVSVFIALGLETAARREAIMELSWDRVDLVAGTIDYHRPGRRLTRKRRVTGLPISDRLLPVLKEAWKEAPKDASGQARGPVVGDARCIVKALRRFTVSVGMPWVTPHVLRHTWGSLAAMAGVPLYDIAKFMGDTYATIERHYLHLTPGHLRGAANFKTMPQPKPAAVA